MTLTHYSKFSMITLRIWVFNSGVFKKYIHKHGSNANIRSTKMANNRHAYNRDVLQSYWTSNGLLLFCSQPNGEKTHANQQYEKLAKIRQTTSNIWSWRHDIAAFGYTDAIRNQSRTQHNTGWPIYLCQQERLKSAWNQQDLSSGESINIHCW